jgi:polar amino acid transport system substrate-binding protein
VAHPEASSAAANARATPNRMPIEWRRYRIENEGTALERQSDAARRELAPAGKLRAGMNLSNTLFARKDAAGGELRGVSVDVMRELAARLGVPLEMVVHDTPGQVADAVNKNTWDAAILAIEQSRAQTIAFSPPISEIEATYVVHKDSKLQSAAQADEAGVRIAAAAKAGYELYLTSVLKSATLVRTGSFAESIDVFNARRADAVAGLKPILLENMAKLPDGRFVEGRFMTVNHGISTPRTRGAAAAYLKAFAEDLNASGFIARSIGQHRVQGLQAVK